MGFKSWIIGKGRIVCYIMLLVTLAAAGYARESTPLNYSLVDPSQCNGGVASGMGVRSLPYPYTNVTYEWQVNPQPWVADYVKYDINFQDINCSTLYLRLKVGAEEGSVTPTNVTVFFNCGPHPPLSIPLHYNVSRGEYVALFDLDPYWYDISPGGPLTVSATVNCTLGLTPGVRYVNILTSPEKLYVFTGSFATFLIIGTSCMLAIEAFVRLVRKYRSVQEEHRKDQALLALLRQQNRGAYESALQKLQEDHRQLLRQIQLEKHSAGDSADA